MTPIIEGCNYIFKIDGLEGVNLSAHTDTHSTTQTYTNTNLKMDWQTKKNAIYCKMILNSYNVVKNKRRNKGRK